MSVHSLGNWVLFKCVRICLRCARWALLRRSQRQERKLSEQRDDYEKRISRLEHELEQKGGELVIAEVELKKWAAVAARDHERVLAETAVLARQHRSEE